MESTTNNKPTTKLDHVLTAGLVADRPKLQELAIKNAPNPIDLMRITGRVISFESVAPKEGSTNKRDTIYIKGMFKGIDLLTNVVHLSGQLILPDSASAFVCAQPMPYNIDVTLTVMRAEKSATGYKFECSINNFDEASMNAAPQEPKPVAPPAAETPSVQASESGGKSSKKSA